VRGNHAARGALSGALLDARLRVEGISLARYLGGSRTHVDAGVAIGRHDNPAELDSEIAGFLALGYRSIKLKIEPGHDLVAVSAARTAAGADTVIQVDANGSYRLEDSAHLAQLDAHGIACLEQPLAPDALLDHARLAELIRTPIGLDETITSAGVARDACELGACSIVSIKTGLVGGIEAARRTHDLCVEAGVAARAGGMLETGVGRAALVALASLPGFTITGDVSASSRYFEHDVTEPFVLDGGQIAVPTGPGLGVTPIPEQLARCTIAHERWINSETAGRNR
jgi:O-succinylbenzoate synthase